MEVLSRFVETPEYVREEAANQILHRRAFGTGSHLSLRTLKNEANTALVYHGGELLALWEGAHASALDPDTLAYLGPHTLGGAARVAPAFSMHPSVDRVLGIGGDAVCAHSHVDPVSGRRAMLLARFSAGSTTLRFLEFEPDSFDVHSERTYSVRGFSHVHDFAVTPTSYVFFAPALDFDARAFRKGASALDCVAQPGETARLIQLPRVCGEARVSIVPRWFATHFINAFEHGPDGLVVDTFGFPGFGEHLSASAPMRFVLENGTCVSAAAIDTHLSEFPVLPARDHGRPYKHAYYSASVHTPMDSVTCLDGHLGTRRYSTVPGGFHLEPVLADEFLLIVLTLGGELWLRVLETPSLREVCRVPLEGANPTGLHGLWVPQ
jgi:all-trans-8'-apo-beta-carotenal 15,15'-oxygenase